MKPFQKFTMTLRRNQRRLADGINPLYNIDLTVDDKEAAPESTSEDDSSYKCPICISDLQSPVSTYCGHVFCSDCLDKALDLGNACPLCKQDVNDVVRLHMDD